jgi:D,D-heptose 1,7-bisphosphate phosphatase
VETVKQAAILIGGKGTRLGKAVRNTPKPLLEVDGRPFVEHVMLNLRRFGFGDFILLAGYQAEIVQEKYGRNSVFARELNADIRVIVEPAPLGTGGALRYAEDYLQDEFLLLNGDSIFDFNYLDLSNCDHRDEPEHWLGRVALLAVDDASRYGLVELDGPLVKAFREKPETPEAGVVNSGVYWLSSKVLNFIDKSPCSLEQDVFPKLLAKGALIGRVYDGFFIDIGIPSDLQRARDNLTQSLRKPAAFLDRDGTLNYDDGYTHRIEEFRWIGGAKTAVKKLNDAGYLVFIVTNQAGIARGYYDDSAVNTLHEWMRGELAEVGAHVDDIRYCPHHLEGTVPALSVACECRKPNAGMLISLIDEWRPDISRSFILGDSDKDAAAGVAAGVTGKVIGPGSILSEIEEILER